FGIISSSSPHEEDEVFSKRFFSSVVDNELFKLVPPEKVVRIIKDARSAADSISPGNYMGERIIANCLETMSEHLVNLHYRTMEDMSFTHFLIGNITKDMTIYGNDEEKCFFSIVNNLYRAHIDSSLIYTYDKPILHSDDEKWKCPETLMLRAYHDGDSLAAVTGESRKIPAGNFLNNSFTPTDRCRVMVVSPLFMCEEQYGFIVCELDNEFFPYIYSITPQICTAIKLTNLVAQLESSLDAAQSRNNMLNRMSMSDELTGVFNRRGFYVNANRILKARENEGKRAVLLFGDLDNLKTINDTFGHDDGDYAIVSAANFIKNSMRGSDVVARIGGDEFAAFALGGDSEITSKLPSRIKNIAKLHNLRSKKPYNVTISIGICEIVCSPDVNIQQYMDMADEALYEDKQHKNRDIMKHDKNDM
ncbi:MAG: GGDEF domain-containing protein, partial [Huintestinicola sp.]